MRVLIRYKLKDDSQLHTCVKESDTMNGACDILRSEKENIKILDSSIIENGQDGILTGVGMLCNTR